MMTEGSKIFFIPSLSCVLITELFNPLLVVKSTLTPTGLFWVASHIRYQWRRNANLFKAQPIQAETRVSL